MTKVHSFGRFEHVVDLSSHGAIAHVDGTDSASFALTREGMLIGWGVGHDHELEGDGDARAYHKAPPSTAVDYQTHAVRVPVCCILHRSITYVACGRSHVVAIGRDGRCLEWGGPCVVQEAAGPQLVEDLQDRVTLSVAAGAEHSLAVVRTHVHASARASAEAPLLTAGDAADSEGDIWAWGRNDYGQLGSGLGSKPAETSSSHNDSNTHGDQPCRCSCFRCAGSFAPRCIGANGAATGNGMGSYRHAAHVKTVAAGWYHSAAITTQGDVLTWGWGQYGQLGHGTLDDEWVPRRIVAWDGVRGLEQSMRAVACGAWHTAVLPCSGDAVYTCGWNRHAQLGRIAVHTERFSAVGATQGGGDIEAVPQLASLLRLCGAEERFVSIACGTRHGAAVTSTGRVLSWGQNAVAAAYEQVCIASAPVACKDRNGDANPCHAARVIVDPCAGSTCASGVGCGANHTLIIF